jgi:ParB/Sulfiredoxin domain
VKTKLLPDITHVKDLRDCPTNARVHNPRNIAMIEYSIERNGFGRSVLIDESGELIAGHGAKEAAINAGITKVRVIDSDGSEIIAVRRRGLTDEQRASLRVSDNRTTDLSEFSYPILMAENEFTDVKQFFFESELEDLRRLSEQSSAELADGSEMGGSRHEDRHQCPKCGHVFTGGKVE